MTNRERAMAVLNYRPYDRLPIVHFGFWGETIQRWQREGHLTAQEADKVWDNSPAEHALEKKLGFDFNWQTMFYTGTGLRPGFESRVVETLPDGSSKVLNGDGMIVLIQDGAGSIPAEVDHLLKGRKEWEELYLPKLAWADDRVDLKALAELRARGPGDRPLGLHCGSLFGVIRNWLGVAGASYLYADDPELYQEIIDTVGNLAYRCVETALKAGGPFDFAHFWEDICFKNGPLVIPSVFDELVGPHYRRITDLVGRHGLNIVSLDCDGDIDALVPIWLKHGVNTMFPIEVGTWGASLEPWRRKFGRDLRGIGGMNKTVLARDRAAVDREIERLRRLVDLGGFIPCPDHRLPPDTEWDNLRHYCDRMHQVFG
jgi:uroporphyrinogen decarboxylase